METDREPPVYTKIDQKSDEKANITKKFLKVLNKTTQGNLDILGDKPKEESLNKRLKATIYHLKKYYDIYPNYFENFISSELDSLMVLSSKNRSHPIIFKFNEHLVRHYAISKDSRYLAYLSKQDDKEHTIFLRFKHLPSVDNYSAEKEEMISESDFINEKVQNLIERDNFIGMVFLSASQYLLMIFKQKFLLFWIDHQIGLLKLIEKKQCMLAEDLGDYQQSKISDNQSRIQELDSDIIFSLNTHREVSTLGVNSTEQGDLTMKLIFGYRSSIFEVDILVNTRSAPVPQTLSFECTRADEKFHANLTKMMVNFRALEEGGRMYLCSFDESSNNSLTLRKFEIKTSYITSSRSKKLPLLIQEVQTQSGITIKLPSAPKFDIGEVKSHLPSPRKVLVNYEDRKTISLFDQALNQLIELPQIEYDPAKVKFIQISSEGDLILVISKSHTISNPSRKANQARESPSNSPLKSPSRHREKDKLYDLQVFSIADLTNVHLIKHFWIENHEPLDVFFSGVCCVVRHETGFSVYQTQPYILKSVTRFAPDFISKLSFEFGLQRSLKIMQVAAGEYLVTRLKSLLHIRNHYSFKPKSYGLVETEIKIGQLFNVKKKAIGGSAYSSHADGFLIVLDETENRHKNPLKSKSISVSRYFEGSFSVAFLANSSIETYDASSQDSPQLGQELVSKTSRVLLPAADSSFIVFGDEDKLMAMKLANGFDSTFALPANPKAKNQSFDLFGNYFMISFTEGGDWKCHIIDLSTASKVKENTWNWTLTRKQDRSEQIEADYMMAQHYQGKLLLLKYDGWYELLEPSSDTELSTVCSGNSFTEAFRSKIRGIDTDSFRSFVSQASASTFGWSVGYFGSDAVCLNLLQLARDPQQEKQRYEHFSYKFSDAEVLCIGAESRKTDDTDSPFFFAVTSDLLLNLFSIQPTQGFLSKKKELIRTFIIKLCEPDPSLEFVSGRMFEESDKLCFETVMVERKENDSNIVTRRITDLRDCEQRFLTDLFSLYFSGQTSSAKSDKQVTQNISRLLRGYETKQIQRSPLMTALIFLLNDDQLMQDYIEHCLPIPILCRDHMIWSLLFQEETGPQNSARSFITKYIDYVARNKCHPYVDQDTLNRAIIYDAFPESKTFFNLLKCLIFSPIDQKLPGQLKDQSVNIHALEPNKSSSSALKEDINGLKSENLTNIRKEIFMEKPKEMLEYELFVTAFKIDLTLGSHFSSQFFALFKDMSNDQFDDDFYETLINFKMRQIKIPMMVMSWILIIKILLVYLFYSLEIRVSGFLPVVYVLNTVLLIFEVKCAISNFTHYLTDMWNLLDGANIFLLYYCMYVGIYHPLEEDNWINRWLKLVLLTIYAFRGVRIFQVFPYTRLIVIKLFKVFFNLLPLLIIFAAFILSFSFVWQYSPVFDVYPTERETFYQTSVMFTNVIFGNFKSGTTITGFKYTITTLANIVLNLTLANFLIAQVSQVYQQIEAKKRMYLVRENLSFILDMDSFFRWKNVNSNEVSYLSFIQQQEKNTEVQALEIKAVQIKQSFLKKKDDFALWLKQTRTSIDELIEKRISRLPAETKKLDESSAFME